MLNMAVHDRWRFRDGLLLLFIGFKLAGLIDWSWLWVLAPGWISVLIELIMAVAFGTAFADKTMKRVRKERSRAS